MNRLFVRYVQKLQLPKSKRVRINREILPLAKLQKNKLSLVGLALFIASCSSVEKKTIDWSQIKSGKWTASGKITEKKTGKSHSLDLSFRAVKDQKVRIDISAMMGTPIASMVLDTSHVEAVLIRQKKIYEGKPTAEVMKEVLGFSFEPRVVFNVLFETIPQGEKWNCSEDGEQFKKCVGPKEDLIITWSNRKDLKRTVELETMEFNLVLSFLDFSPTELSDPKIFVVKKPKSFKVIELR